MGLQINPDDEDLKILKSNTYLIIRPGLKWINRITNETINRSG
jgi:hypothetical protein